MGHGRDCKGRRTEGWISGLVRSKQRREGGREDDQAEGRHGRGMLSSLPTHAAGSCL